MLGKHEARQTNKTYSACEYETETDFALSEKKNKKHRESDSMEIAAQAGGRRCG